MKTYNNIEDLKANSILVLTGMISVSPQFNTEEDIYIDVDDAPKFNGCYATNNSTVAFIDNGLLYATPYTRGAIKFLQSAGFKKKTFYVPFSNWDYPKFQAEKWFLLKQQAASDMQLAFEEDCKDWCEDHGIGEIAQSLLDKCFMMPDEGVRVKHFYYEDTYYPAINSQILDCIATERLGTYCCNNGRVVFVYRDGHTYVARGYKILRTLCVAGYKSMGLFVPFSNGEEILDPQYAAQWEEICASK